MVMTQAESFSVDTEEDRARVEGEMALDALRNQYSNAEGN
jgi:hypothetical protein